jgi:hypothetical protein
LVRKDYIIGSDITTGLCKRNPPSLFLWGTFSCGTSMIWRKSFPSAHVKGDPLDTWAGQNEKSGWWTMLILMFLESNSSNCHHHAPLSKLLPITKLVGD